MEQDNKNKPTKRELIYGELLALKKEWPQYIFAIGKEEDADYITMALILRGFVQIRYKYHDLNYLGFYIVFTNEYYPEFDEKWFKTAESAFDYLLVWMNKRGIRFKRYDEPKVIDNQFD